MHRFLTFRFLHIVVFGILILAACFFAWRFFFPPIPHNAETFADEYELVLQDYTGNNVRLFDFKREVLIVYLWASWCPYCKEELQNLSALAEEKGGVRIIAVNRAEPPADARAFTDTLSLSSHVTLLLDKDDALYKKSEGYAMPETLFIDRHGVVVDHHRGPIQKDAVRARVDALLAQ